MHTLKREHRHHLDKKLLFRLRIYFIISLILVGVVIYEILSNNVSISLAFIGLILGTLIGVVVARMFLISWDKDAKKVISRLDILGIFILIIYIIFAVFRSKIIGIFIQGNYVTGMSLSMVAGIMIGRVFGTGHKIVSILKEEQII